MTINKLDDKDREILSMEMHMSKDDSSEFQQVQPRRKPKPHVTLIGTSNISDIDEKLSPDFTTNKIKAYTFEETEKEIKQLSNAPTVLVLHSLTNELKLKPPEDCVDEMIQIVNSAHEQYPSTHIIVSLPTPRNDSAQLNFNGQKISLSLKDKLRRDDYVTLCDNSNLAYKGEAQPRFLKNDGFHLNSPGRSSILAANIRDTIDRVLDLPQRTPHRQQPSHNTYRGRGGGRGAPYFRGLRWWTWQTWPLNTLKQTKQAKTYILHFCLNLFY